MARPSFLDLFCGCGGLTSGFVAEGFRVVAGFDHDLQSCATYASNFGASKVRLGDLTEVEDVPSVDLVIGGPPCQGFSNLGKKDPDDHRNRLWNAYVDVVVASGCQAFVLENVERFSRSVELAMLRAETGARGRLRGWSLQAYGLNAADFGVPQRRVRTIIVGSRLGPVPDPVATHGPNSSDQRPWRTVRHAISQFAFDQRLPDKLPERWTDLGGQAVPGPFKLDEIHVGRRYERISLDRYKHIAPGRNRFDLPDDLQMDCWKRHRTGAGDVLGRLEWDRPSVTIRTEFFKPEKGRYLHPEWSRRGRKVNRAITHAEAAALQGFEDDHVWCGTKVGIARQIGNAVPPPLAAAVARGIRPIFA